MTTVGWVGLGKLGLPCALALSQSCATRVVGYDHAPHVAKALASGELPGSWYEHDLDRRLQLNARAGGVSVAGSVRDVVDATDELVFIAVQTPHPPGYAGDRPPVGPARDFDYGPLTQAFAEVVFAAADLRKHVTVVIVSTVSPGVTQQRLVDPLQEFHRGFVTVVYNPFLIALGSTIRDFLEPPVILMGAEDPVRDLAPLNRLYARSHPGSTAYVTRGFETTELLKLAYNTLVTQKIVWANAVTELAGRVGASAAEVLTGVRLINGDRDHVNRGLYPGLGDGGPCRPRDLVVLDQLANSHRLSANVWDVMTEARERQSLRLAEYVAQWRRRTGRDVWILGTAYKPESSLEVGSAALLLAYQLRELNVPVRTWDPFVNGTPGPPDMVVAPAVYVLGTPHAAFASLRLPRGSVVIDPFHGAVRLPGDVEVYAPGEFERA